MTVFSFDIEGRAKGSESAYALHLQCGFWLVFEERVVLGFEDLLRPLGGATREEYVRTVNDTVDDPTVFDVRAHALDPVIARDSLTVHRVSLLSAGVLRVALAHEFQIEVVPMSSYRKESWRFVHRGAEHVVFPWQ